MITTRTRKWKEQQRASIIELTIINILVTKQNRTGRKEACFLDGQAASKVGNLLDIKILPK